MLGDHSLPTRSASTKTKGSENAVVEEDYSAVRPLSPVSLLDLIANFTGVRLQLFW